MDIYRMLVDALTGDRDKQIEAYQQAIQAYLNKITSAIMPLNDLSLPFAVVALRCVTNSVEAVMDDNQRSIADQLSEHSVTTAIKMPNPGCNPL